MIEPTLTFSTHDDALRRRIAEWLHRHAPGSGPADYVEHLHWLAAWQARLAAAGFMGLSWPSAYGGQGLGLAAEAVLAEELGRAGMPELVNRLALYAIGPTIIEWGTEAQRRRFLPGMLDASEIWCQAFSEPGAGSDLAAIQTRAERVGEDLVVNGQKVWTSRAYISKWCAMLVRTDARAERHAGLSLVVVDMHSPGVTVRPLLQMMHEPHFSEIFLDGVRVPLDRLIGPLGGGWRVAMSTLGYERGLFVLERQIRLQRRLDDLADRILDMGPRDGVVERLGVLVARLESLRAEVYRSLAAQAAGTLRPGATSVDKLLLATAEQELFAAAFDLLAPAPAFVDDGWAHDLLGSRSVSIYSGTSEIQRNVIARQLLGLP